MKFKSKNNNFLIPHLSIVNLGVSWKFYFYALSPHFDYRLDLALIYHSKGRFWRNQAQMRLVNRVFTFLLLVPTTVFLTWLIHDSSGGPPRALLNI